MKFKLHSSMHMNIYVLLFEKLQHKCISHRKGSRHDPHFHGRKHHVDCCHVFFLREGSLLLFFALFPPLCPSLLFSRPLISSHGRTDRPILTSIFTHAPFFNFSYAVDPRGRCLPYLRSHSFRE